MLISATYTGHVLKFVSSSTEHPSSNKLGALKDDKEHEMTEITTYQIYKSLCFIVFLFLLQLDIVIELILLFIGGSGLPVTLLNEIPAE